MKSVKYKMVEELMGYNMTVRNVEKIRKSKIRIRDPE